MAAAAHLAYKIRLISHVEQAVRKFVLGEEDLGGDGGGETMTRTYYIRLTLFLIKKK